MATRSMEIKAISPAQRKQMATNINAVLEARDYSILVEWQGEICVLQGLSSAGNFVYLLTESKEDVDSTTEVALSPEDLRDLALQVFMQVDLCLIGLSSSIEVKAPVIY